MFEDCEIISTYTDADALADGGLIDIGAFGVRAQGKPVNRLTPGAADHFRELSTEALTLAVASVQNVVPDWFYALPCGLWLAENETAGFTLLRPDEY